MSTEALQIAKHVGPSAAILNIPHNLTEIQKAFCDHWLLTRNGTESARIAGYKGDDNQLAVQASTNLRLAKVEAYINQNLRLSMMSADEVLKRLSKQGRASIADVLNDKGEFSLRHAKKKGTDDLVRKLKIKKTRRTDPVTKEEIEETTHELELHNSQTALELMGKHHRLFADVVETQSTIVNVDRQELVVILQGALSAGLSAIDVTPEPESALSENADVT